MIELKRACVFPLLGVHQALFIVCSKRGMKNKLVVRNVITNHAACQMDLFDKLHFDIMVDPRQNSLYLRQVQNDILQCQDRLWCMYLCLLSQKLYCHAGEREIFAD